jgi:hypothetical protein
MYRKNKNPFQQEIGVPAFQDERSSKVSVAILGREFEGTREESGKLRCSDHPGFTGRGTRKVSCQPTHLCEPRLELSCLFAEI